MCVCMHVHSHECPEGHHHWIPVELKLKEIVLLNGMTYSIENNFKVAALTLTLNSEHGVCPLSISTLFSPLVPNVSDGG